MTDFVEILRGTTLTVALDGVDKASVTDAAYESGAVGIVIHSGGSPHTHRR